jgi:phosphoribosylformylglycinamidine synthase
MGRVSGPDADKDLLMRARVFVTLKPSVFDPQGTTVGEALHTLGYTSVTDVRQGKYFELEIDAGTVEEVTKIAAAAADRLLANPVIESYRIDVDPAPAVAGAARRSSQWSYFPDPTATTTPTTPHPTCSDRRRSSSGTRIRACAEPTR